MNSSQAIGGAALHDFIDKAPVGVFRTCGDGRIEFANSAFVRMLGFPSVDDLKKINAHDLCADSRDSHIWLRELKRTGTVQNFETRLNCHAGESVWVELHARSISDDSGKLMFYDGVAIDISLRKKAEEALINMAASLEDSFGQTILSISRMMEKRDPYTALHQRRVAHLAYAISTELRIPELQIRGVYLAALIHDLGKIFVPLEFLCRPGPLGKNETELIRRHTCSGFEVLKNISCRWPIPMMVQQHHERLDGTGYPYGLGRRDILLESRIIAVADTVEAISEHRPYRPAKGVDVALTEISSGRGTAYDNDVVDAVMRIFLEQKYQIADDILDELVVTA